MYQHHNTVYQKNDLFCPRFVARAQLQWTPCMSVFFLGMQRLWPHEHKVSPALFGRLQMQHIQRNPSLFSSILPMIVVAILGISIYRYTPESVEIWLFFKIELILGNLICWRVGMWYGKVRYFRKL